MLTFGFGTNYNQGECNATKGWLGTSSGLPRKEGDEEESSEQRRKRERVVICGFLVEAESSTTTQAQLVVSLLHLVLTWGLIP